MTTTGYVRKMREEGLKIKASEVKATMEYVTRRLRSLGRKPRRYRWHRKLFLNRMRREGLA